MAIKSRFARNVGIVAIAIPMLLYGASSFDNTGEAQPVVQVGDRNVNKATLDRQVERAIETQAEVYGDETVNSDEFRSLVERQLLSSFAQNLLMQERASDIGIHPPDDEILHFIQQDEQFQEGGEYSPELFQTLVEDKTFFLRELRKDLESRKVNTVFSGAEIVSQQITDGLVSYLNESRVVRKIEFPLEYPPDLREITEEDISAFYEENIESYVLPFKAKFEYIEVTPELFDDDIVIDEEVLAAAQEERARQAEVNEERQLGLIVLESEDEAIQAQELIDSGSEFETVAGDMSVDAGSSSVGGDIGLLARDDLDEAISGPVFEASIGDVVGPFESDGQWLLFKVKGLIGGHVDDFEDIREQLVAQLKREEIEVLMSDKATEAEELAFEAFDSLETVAEEVGLELQQTDWIDNQITFEELPHPFDDAAVINEVFTTEFIEGRLNSGLLLREDGSYVIARSFESEPSRQQPLTEVRDQIHDTLREQEALVLTFQDLSAKVEAQQEGDVVPELPFAEQAALTVNLIDELPEELSEQQRRLLYELGDSEGETLPAYTFDYDDETGIVAVMRLEDILPGEVGDDETQQAINIQAQFTSNLLLLGYLGELEGIYDLRYYTYETAQEPS